MRRLHIRPTYANVVSTLALVIAVGGGGVAVAASVGANSVGSRQVINESLKSKDVMDGTLTQADLTSGSVGIVRGYAWNNVPSGAVGTPTQLTHEYVYNSGGGPVTVTRSGTGTYTVDFTGLSFYPGNVQVTSYGGTANYCKVSGWGDSTVDVKCYDPAGAAADNTFSLAVIE